MNSIPANTSILGEIKKFHPIAPGHDIRQGVIELVNGTILRDVDAVIFGTGYRYAFPYLPQYHNSSVRGADIPDVVEQPIVTDGGFVRSLFLDTFYIDQPTIAFQGQNVGIQTFVYGKFLGAAIAKVWSGHARLPSSKRMWAFFWNTVEERGGLKKGFQWLTADLNRKYLRQLVAWVNDAAVRYGGEQIALPPDASEEMKLWSIARQVRSDLFQPVQPLGIGLDSFDKLWTKNPEADYSQAAMDDW